MALEAIVDSLVEKEVVTPAEQPRFAKVRELSFRHRLLRGTAYASLTEVDRKLGHRIAAQWLDQMGEEPETVALHWLEGGDRARAASAFSRAGEERWNRVHADAAVRCAARALAVGDASVEDVDSLVARLRLLARAIEATRTIDVRDVIVGIERHLVVDEDAAPMSDRGLVWLVVGPSLEALRRRAANHQVVLGLAFAACVLGVLCDFDAARRLIAEATEHANDDVRSLREIRYASTKLAYWANEGTAAIAIMEDTLLPEDANSRFEILLVLAWAVVSVDGREALPRGLEFVSRAEAIRGLRGTRSRFDEPTSDPLAQLQCSKVRFLCLCLAGDHEAAAETGEGLVFLARTAGLRFDESAHLHNTAEMYLRLGDKDRARAGFIESNAIARDIGAARVMKHNELLLAYVNGEVERLTQLAEELAGTDPWVELYARFWLGQLLTSMKSPKARPALEAALVLARSLRVRLIIDDCTRTLAALDASPN